MNRVVDAHQHFWRGDDPWLPEAWGPLHRTFSPKDLEPELAKAGVDATIIVQAHDSIEDTESMLAVAKDHPFAIGVVGWVPLHDVAVAEAAIERWAATGSLCGVRHLINAEADPDWLAWEGLVPGFELLERCALPFDVAANQPRHLEHSIALAARVPGLRLVIDHLAKPPIAAGGWEPWATLLAEAARRPNVYAKLSGLMTPAAPGTSTSDLEPYVNHALEHFGPARVMAGSDWPVSTLAADYQSIWAGTTELVSHLGDDERAAVLGGTALRCYGLPRDVPPGRTTVKPSQPGTRRSERDDRGP